jgi:hypothetical protein
MDFVVQSGFDLDYETTEKIVGQVKEFIGIEAKNALSFFDD